MLEYTEETINALKRIFISSVDDIERIYANEIERLRKENEELRKVNEDLRSSFKDGWNAAKATYETKTGGAIKKSL